jgi:hypothetical protein
MLAAAVTWASLSFHMTDYAAGRRTGLAADDFFRRVGAAATGSRIYSPLSNHQA